MLRTSSSPTATALRLPALVTCGAILGTFLLGQPAAAADPPAAPADEGPTLELDYGESPMPNPIASFMYFVPLISPVPIGSHSSTGNTQRVRLVSYKKKIRNDTFETTCALDIVGAGSHVNPVVFEDAVRKSKRQLDSGQPLKHVMQYIRIDGPCKGRVFVRGRLLHGKPVADFVSVQFTRRGSRSAVTVGLADIKAEGDTYVRFNEMTARVKALEFGRSAQRPKVLIRLKSVRPADAREGLWASFKGVLANMVLPPVPCEREGRDTMLAFGEALFNQAPRFTFPVARNLKEDG